MGINPEIIYRDNSFTFSLKLFFLNIKYINKKTAKYPMLSLISVDIDSITLNSVTGLPPNFDYYCDPPSCGFIGGTTECAELYSLVDPTVNDIGNYQIVFEISLCL